MKSLAICACAVGMAIAPPNNANSTIERCRITVLPPLEYQAIGLLLGRHSLSNSPLDLARGPSDPPILSSAFYMRGLLPANNPAGQVVNRRRPGTENASGCLLDLNSNDFRIIDYLFICIILPLCILYI